MAEMFSETVEVKDENDAVTIKLDAKRNTVTIGATDEPGKLILKDDAGNDRLTLVGRSAQVLIGTLEHEGHLAVYDRNATVFEVSGLTGRVRVGRKDNPGQLIMRDNDGEDTLSLDGGEGKLKIGRMGHGGRLHMIDDEDHLVFKVEANDSHLSIGDSEKAGSLGVTDGQGQTALSVHGATARIKLGSENNPGNLTLDDGTNRAVFKIDGEDCVLTLGTTLTENNFVIQNDGNREVLRVDMPSKALIVGGEGAGHLKVHDSFSNNVFHFNGGTATLSVGADGNEGDIKVKNNSGETVIHLDGGSGDIILNNADCAEEFDIAAAAALDAGTVMVLDAEGALRESTEAYDKKVAGVLSGAGEYRPGILLDRKGPGENRRPLALMGKVYCKVDADGAPVEVGDLLTTSPTPGHAMKAADPMQAFGAVIGKALRPLKEGRDLIPILVALQ